MMLEVKGSIKKFLESLGCIYWIGWTPFKYDLPPGTTSFFLLLQVYDLMKRAIVDVVTTFWNDCIPAQARTA